MVAERVNSSQKLLNVGEKGVYSSYTHQKEEQEKSLMPRTASGFFGPRRGGKWLPKRSKFSRQNLDKLTQKILDQTYAIDGVG